MDPTQNNVFGNQPPMGTGGFGAPMDSGVPMSSGTGDIVLNNGGGKSKKKWWIVILLIVLVAVIAGVVVWFFVVRPSNHAVVLEETKDSWKDYYNYLMFGPDGEEKEATIENWYLVAINDADPGELSYADFYNNYYTTLKSKFESFYKVVPEKNDNIIKYGSMLQAVIDYNTMDTLKGTVIEKYKEAGISGGRTYIDGIGANLTEGGFARYMYDYIKKYLEVFLSIVDYYESNGCDYNESQSLDCLTVSSSSELQNKMISSSRVANNMNYYYNELFADEFFSETYALNVEIGEL